MNPLSLALAALLLGTTPAHAKERVDVPRPAKFVAAAEWGSDPDPIPDDRRQTPRFVTGRHAGLA